MYVILNTIIKVRFMYKTFKTKKHKATINAPTN